MTTTLSPWRADIITGSRLPAILGLSPYQTRDGVLREMVRDYFDLAPDFVGNIATEWGTEHEADAIAEYEMTRGVTVHKAGSKQEIVLHPELAFLGVTPDGLVGEDGLAEAKCPYRSEYTHFSQRPDYEVQLRLAMECTGRKWGDLIVWRREGIVVSRVERDPDWFATVLGQIGEFMAEYRATIADPALAEPYREPLVDHRTDEEWQTAAMDYLECLAAKKAAQVLEDQAKAELVRLAGKKKSTRGFGVLLTRSDPQGSIAYKEALAKLQPDADLEAFRGDKPASKWTARLAT
jgi:putative phage-type endonuclease